jgi:hypothetical protein
MPGFAFQENTMAEATIELKLTEQEKQELVERAAADVIRRLATSASAQITVPRVGDVWPGQGGIYAGIVRPDDGSAPYHLIVASGGEGETTDIAWGGEGESEPGAESKWNGKANTLALVESEHEHPAAEWAAGLKLGGHNDWYLPSQRELMLCYVNVAEIFEKVWHWSSSQCSSTYAWGQYFGNGYTGDDTKGNEARARAVRSVVVTN